MSYSRGASSRTKLSIDTILLQAASIIQYTGSVLADAENVEKALISTQWQHRLSLSQKEIHVDNLKAFDYSIAKKIVPHGYLL